jgi:hypothetical protein
MRFRERHHEDRDQRHDPGVPGGPEGGGLGPMRQAGESLFHAADDAITRALSGDSQAFLNATRQEGGQ